ncbi:hypothetical protein [Polycladidibacter hongkongensis]|uniref:hypothetical protein n=1 Tax=Polycladidibacter hongkongensis TaxID=1647556 RepID=UPI0012E390E0|nr:hypothetical protein [Pseudovibrio hongkongensis]
MTICLSCGVVNYGGFVPPLGLAQGAKHKLIQSSQVVPVWLLVHFFLEFLPYFQIMTLSV